MYMSNVSPLLLNKWTSSSQPNEGSKLVGTTRTKTTFYTMGPQIFPNGFLKGSHNFKGDLIVAESASKALFIFGNYI